MDWKKWVVISGIIGASFLPSAIARFYYKDVVIKDGEKKVKYYMEELDDYIYYDKEKIEFDFKDLWVKKKGTYDIRDPPPFSAMIELGGLNWALKFKDFYSADDIAKGLQSYIQVNDSNQVNKKSSVVEAKIITPKKEVKKTLENKITTWTSDYLTNGQKYPYHHYKIKIPVTHVDGQRIHWGKDFGVSWQNISYMFKRGTMKSGPFKRGQIYNDNGDEKPPFSALIEACGEKIAESKFGKYYTDEEKQWTWLSVNDRKMQNPLKCNENRSKGFKQNNKDESLINNSNIDEIYLMLYNNYNQNGINDIKKTKKFFFRKLRRDNEEMSTKVRTYSGVLSEAYYLRNNTFNKTKCENLYEIGINMQKIILDMFPRSHYVDFYKQNIAINCATKTYYYLYDDKWDESKARHVTKIMYELFNWDATHTGLDLSVAANAIKSFCYNFRCFDRTKFGDIWKTFIKFDKLKTHTYWSHNSESSIRNEDYATRNKNFRLYFINHKTFDEDAIEDLFDSMEGKLYYKTMYEQALFSILHNSLEMKKDNNLKEYLLNASTEDARKMMFFRDLIPADY